MGKGAFIGLLIVVVILGVVGFFFMTAGEPAKCQPGQYWLGGEEQKCAEC